ncbi:uncharacterized protein LOC144693711 isoform X2 [Cetorhinus maximus]
MTPEVKEAIISYVEKTHEKINKDTSICYQLKALFSQLATQTADTHGITKNLGMSGDDVFIQQDIEEYFRKLLNEVATESEGSCKILQIDSFEDFLKVTTLSGDNLCYCETCDEKTETETRYYFESLPKILAVQLKRFEFDYFKMCFTKLDDELEIPLKLTFQKKITDTDKTEWSLISVESKEAAKTHLTYLESPPSNVPRNEEYEESQKPAKDESQKHNTTYELFAICDHSGGYGSGHYVAYIKPISSCNWYCFNDTKANKIGDLISRTDCDGVGSPSSMPYISLPTAYMLMYRKEEVSTYQGENEDEEKQSNELMSIRNENGSLELEGMGDGAEYHHCEQSNQPPNGIIEDLPENNATVAIERNATMEKIEKRNCEMKENERQTQETEVKEDTQTIKEKSTEADDMVTPEEMQRTQGEQCQIGRKENITREGPVGQLKDSERKTETIKETIKENGGEHLNEEFMESNADEKNIKGANGTEGKICVKVERMKDETIVQEGKDIIGQNKTELVQEKQKEMVQISESEESQQHQGCKEPIDMEQNNYPSAKEEKPFISEKACQEEERVLLLEIKKGEGVQEEISGKMTSRRQSESETTETENETAEKKRRYFCCMRTSSQKKEGPKEKSKRVYFSCLGKGGEN